MRLGEEIFGYPEDQYFEDLPLDAQKRLLDSIKEKHKYFLKKYKSNSGVLGGRNRKYSDGYLERVIQETDEIKKTDEYLKRRITKNDSKTAYVIYYEQIFNHPESQTCLKECDFKVTDDFIRECAEALKEAIKRHKARTKET